MDRRQFLISSAATAAFCAGEARAHTVIGGAGGLSDANGDALPEALRDKLMHDPLRPQFHLLPKANWMNDPCAPRFYRGQYHMFFQYNPNGPEWGDMHWNHATSPDLIHWKHQPIALAPTPGSFDAYGIFTGSVLPGMEVPTVLYTGTVKSSADEETIRGGGVRETQCLATSTDPNLLVWKKLDKPVIDAPPPGLKVTGFRDPCPWKEGDLWYLGVGSGFDKKGGAVLLYRSHDGRSWEYLHPLAVGEWNEKAASDPVDSGEMWECPDFFPLGGKHVLLYSAERKVYWEVGVFDKSDLKFHTETKGMLDHGCYYAMKSMVDKTGRRILWGWAPETRPTAEYKAAGWSGSMALPRALTLGADNKLRMEVPPEFASLRRKMTTLHAPGAEALAKLAINNRAGGIQCSFKPGGSGGGLELRERGASAPIFALKYEGTGDTAAVSIGEKKLPLTPDKQGISTLDLWMDGSILELFLDKREASTERCYAQSTGPIQIVWTGAPEALKSFSVSDVAPISSDRLTS